MQIIRVDPDDKSDVITVGRRGENLARQIAFDISAWKRLYGPGIAVLNNQRIEDATPYPVGITQICGEVHWIITSTDTAKAGKYGKLELRYYVGDALVKSRTWRTIVEKALDIPDYDPDDPGAMWGEQILSAGAHAQKAAKDAQASADRAEQQAAYQGYMVMDIIDGVLYYYRTPNVSVDFEMEEGELMLLWPIAETA